MNNMPKEFLEKIENYNGNQYYELAGIIKKELDEKLENKVILNEYLAFQLYVSYDKLTNWGTYYGPYMTFRNEDGTYTESPGKEYITNNSIEYWKKRVKETKNLFLKFRYLDLIYDLEENVTGNKVDYKNIIDLIEIGIQAIKERVFTDLDGKDILKRLISIIISINKIDEYKEIIELTINYEKHISIDDKPGLWGFSFDYLVNNKKIKLDQKLEKSIIDDLENKLNNLSDIYLIKFCGERLTQYYKFNSDNNNLLRVLSRIKEVSYNIIKDSTDGLLVANYFQELINIYSLYQECKEIKDEKNIIVNDFQQKTKTTSINYKDIKTSFKVTDQEMDEYVNYFFKTEEGIIQRICVGFVISKKNSKKILDGLIEKYPLQFIINRKILDENGFPIHTIKGIEEDYDGNLYHQITQDLTVGSIFIDTVLLKFIKKYTVDNLIKELRENIIYKEEDEQLIKNILESYYKGNYLEFNFLVIPFIEKSFRSLNELVGYTVINFKDDKIEYKSLDYLIRSGIIKDIFKSRGDDFELYFRLILTMIEGWNLRNNLAHGIELNHFYDKNISNRLFHILLCFSLIRFVELKK